MQEELGLQDADLTFLEALRPRGSAAAASTAVLGRVIDLGYCRYVQLIDDDVVQ